MQPVTIEARPAVRASDAGRTVTAAASGSASFAALLLETGTGSREPVTSAPRPAGKSEAPRPKGDTEATGSGTTESGATEAGTTEAAGTGTADASASETDEDGEQPQAAPAVPPMPALVTPPGDPAQATLAAGAQAAAAAVVPPGAQPAPTSDAPPAGAAPTASSMPLQAEPDVAAAPGGEVQLQAQAETAARPAAEAAPTTFEEILASTAGATADRAAQPAGTNAKPRHTAMTQGGAQSGGIGDAAQAAVEPAAQGRGADTTQMQPGAATASDIAASTWTRSDAPAAASALSPTAPATPQTTDAAAPTAPRAPMPAPAVHDQLAVHIQRAIGQGVDRITIHLSPAELGRIDVRLEMVEAGRVTATVAVDRPETLDLLQRDSRGLERALQDAGLKADTGGLSFTLRDDGRRDTGGRQPFGAAGDGSRTANAEAARVEPVVAARTIYSDGAIDIRV